MTQSATFQLEVDGVPLPVALTTSVLVQFYSEDGLTPLTKARAVDSAEGGAAWPTGLIGVEFQSQELAALAPPAAMAVLSSNQFVQRFKLDVLSPTALVKSDLFIKDYAIKDLRKERLMLLAQTFFPNVSFSDDFLWEKILVAESETQRDLRVPLVLTQFFGVPPTPDQLAAGIYRGVPIPPGIKIGEDPAQTYDPDFFQGEKWGFLTLRFKPVLKVQLLQFTYPAPTTGFFDFPLDWIRLDQKYGQLQLIPASSTFIAPLNAFLLQAIGGGRTIPFAFNIMYQAGIVDVRREYPQIIDVIKRRAVLKIIEDGFIPTSASISGDGLSQSLSVSMEQYRDTIQTTLFGPKDREGGLVTAIHGIKLYSMGS